MSKLLSRAVQIHDLFVRAVCYLQSPFLLAVRLYWGWQFWQTGWGKLTNIPHVVKFFTSLNIPFPTFNAYFVSGLEFVGGILLFVGLGSRLIALPLAFDMFMAYFTADREALTSIFSDPGKFYNADPYTFLFAALLILICGPGKISLDALIERYLDRHIRKSPGKPQTAVVV
jgi:putative oxidoreductase